MLFSQAGSQARGVCVMDTMCPWPAWLQRVDHLSVADERHADVFTCCPIQTRTVCQRQQQQASYGHVVHTGVRRITKTLNSMTHMINLLS